MAGRGFEEVSTDVTESAPPSAEALSHEANCRCPACRAFWWELFVVSDERTVMTGAVPSPGGG